MSLDVSCVVCFFFVKQKTAYEMRISDWSSDVCSSDLNGFRGRDGRRWRCVETAEIKIQCTAVDNRRRIGHVVLVDIQRRQFEIVKLEVEAIVGLQVHR